MSCTEFMEELRDHRVAHAVVQRPEGDGQRPGAVEGKSIATAAEARFEEMFAMFRCLDPEDPERRHRAGLRPWMRYSPAVLSP